MRNPSLEVRLKVLAAVDYAEGSSILTWSSKFDQPS